MKRNVLESFSSVLSRQKPEVAGKPYKMKVFSNSLPRSVGDPWRGAYSAHGFWYQFHEAGDDEFKKIVAHSYEQDEYMLNYDYLSSWQNAYGASSVRVLVAKNLKNEIMGGVVAIRKETYTQIGTYFVKEEFRHSGIGIKLFKEISRGTDAIMFQAMHHLHETLQYVSLTLQKDRRFFHYRLDNPSGFSDLKDSTYRLIPLGDLSEKDWLSLSTFDHLVSGELRPLRHLLSLEDSCTAVIFNEKNECMGYGVLRELAGGFVKRLLVGPLFAETEDIAQSLLKAVLKKYYNPSEDFDFDPDCFAIYRRNVHFLVPEDNSKIIDILELLKGKDGTSKRERMWYQTSSSTLLPGININNVYSVGDLHSALI